MAGKYEYLINYNPKPSDNKVRNDLESFNREDIEALGEPVRKYMNDDLVESADLSFHVREIKRVPSDTPAFSGIHSHPTSSTYGFVGDITFEITLEDEKYMVDGPAAVFIPANLMHTLRAVRGSGYLVAISRTEQKDND